MNCPDCQAEVGDSDERCATCGADLRSGGGSPVDQIPDDAARAVHDVVRAVQSVQQLGDEVGEASKSVARTVGSERSGVGKVWKATKALTARSGRRVKTAGRTARSKGKSVGRRMVRAGRRAPAKGRTTVHRAVRRTAGRRSRASRR